MALAKPTNQNTTPAFEDNEDVAVMDAPEVETKAKPEVKTTAVAEKASSALAPTGAKFKAALQHLELQLDLESVRSLGQGTLPKIVADRAGFELGDKLLGDWVRMQVVSYNRRWLVSAGVEGDEGKKLLRTSYDKETLENETMSMKEYIEHLKEEGYNRASDREYIDLWVMVTETEKEGVVPEDELELVQFQLSPTSVRSFLAYQVQAGFQAALTKREVSDVVKATVERRENDGNKYAAAVFSS